MIALYILAGLLSTPVISFALVGVGLFFKVDKGERVFKDGTSTTQYDLPQWLLWSTNPEDGLTGDHRGWYWNVYMKGRPDWWKMLVWSAWRNPFNYLKRFIWGIDIRNYLFSKVVGQDYVRDDFDNTGFQILKATPTSKKGFNKYLLYWVYRYGKSDRALVIQLGWKIKLDHNHAVEADEWDYWKGLTFEINPYKGIS
jgi:hypothetical protein